MSTGLNRDARRTRHDIFLHGCGPCTLRPSANDVDKSILSVESVLAVHDDVVVLLAGRDLGGEWRTKHEPSADGSLATSYQSAKS